MTLVLIQTESPSECSPCSSELELGRGNPEHIHRNAALNPCLTDSPGTGPTTCRCSWIDKVIGLMFKCNFVYECSTGII